MQQLHEFAKERPGLQLTTSQPIRLSTDDGVVVLEAVEDLNNLYLHIITPVDAIIRCKRAKARSKAKFTFWPSKDTKVDRIK